MKLRSQTITADGFDKNVAEKMPKIRKLEDPLPENLGIEPQSVIEDLHPPVHEIRIPEKPVEERVVFESSKRETDTEQGLDVFKIVEDLHAQLLASSRTKRALEIDLVASQKAIYQLAQDNKELRSQMDHLNKEIQRFKETHTESVYLKEENEDALERIRDFQQELRDMKESLARTTQERDEALNQLQDLESQMEQNEVFKIRGKLKEREASHFFEENRELQSKLEESLNRNMELERKYEALRRSFNELKESLILLRDSYKTNFYNSTQEPE
ncbi:MAG: hypothetical protein A2169_08040 [Deltaproteobacteria bacterium RBG_13_47_9]|nr:MAG: hypothetical protein A2169_08040 [Deltaproteobacteria bacterium RBG_13_47_9]